MLLPLALLAASLPDAADADWPTYVNLRYGYAICHPAALHAEPEADNGDGRKFTGRGGAALVVFGQFNALDQSLNDWAIQGAKHYMGAKGRISYRAGKGNWIVLSGTDGAAHEFYTRSIRGNDVFVTFQLSYSVADAAVFRPMVARLTRCMRLTRPPS